MTKSIIKQYIIFKSRERKIKSSLTAMCVKKLATMPDNLSLMPGDSHSGNIASCCLLTLLPPTPMCVCVCVLQLYTGIIHKQKHTYLSNKWNQKFFFFFCNWKSLLLQIRITFGYSDLNIALSIQDMGFLKANITFSLWNPQKPGILFSILVFTQANRVTKAKVSG